MALSVGRAARNVVFRGVLCVVVLGPVARVAGVVPPTDIRAEAPALTSIRLTWNLVSSDEEGFRIERDGAVLPGVLLPREARDWTDTRLTTAREYVYRVGPFRGTDPPQWSNRAWAMPGVANAEFWPIRGVTSDHFRVGYTYGEYFNYTATPELGLMGNYHPGVDVMGAAGSVVVAPFAGRVNSVWGVAPNQAVELRVRYGGRDEFVTLGHLQPRAAPLAVAPDDWVMAGAQIGEVGAQLFGVYGAHTHVDRLVNPMAAGATREADSRHFLQMYGRVSWQDPHGTMPAVLDRTRPVPLDADTERIQYRPDAGGAYFTAKTAAGSPWPQPTNVFILQGPVDVVVEAEDDMGHPEKPAALFGIGYWVESKVDSRGHDVRSAGTPYLLHRCDPTLFDGPTPQTDRIYELGKRVLPNWNGWDALCGHYVVTNTRGTDGAMNHVDATQCWMTTAANSGAGEPNGLGKGTATRAQDAWFPDGHYRVHVRVSDLVVAHQVWVDDDVWLENFPPAVVQKTGGTGKVPCEVVIEFSEPMRSPFGSGGFDWHSADTGEVVGYTESWDDSGCTVTLTADGDTPAGRYTVFVDAQWARDLSGGPNHTGALLDGEFGTAAHNGIGGEDGDSVSWTFDCPGTRIGACCFSDGLCDMGPCSWPADTSDCADLGGACYEGATCLDPRACCLPDGPCVETTQECCNHVGGFLQPDLHCVDVPLNACCFSDGRCVDTRAECCDSAGGTFHGDTICGGVGACCLASGECAQMDEVCCAEQGGTFHLGQDCADTGACCLPNGDCLETTELCCEDVQGWFYPGEDCLETGACCTGGGQCRVTTQSCCEEVLGGIFFAGAGCDDTGACCLPDGGCFETTAECCEVEGGWFHGDADCWNVGACCFNDGSCWELAEPCCADLDGSFHAGEDCTNVGACCFGDEDCWDDMAEPCCTELGGSFHGGEACTPTGACCFADGDCWDDLAEPCCDDLGGSFHAGEACTPTGACCFADGDCWDDLAEPCCDDLGGSFHAGEACTPTGACCFANGECRQLPEPCCADLGGWFHAGDDCVLLGGACCLANGDCKEMPQPCCGDLDGTFHLGGTCANVGACCLLDGTCRETAEACCADLGGGFMGAGRACGATGACCLSDGSCVITSEACCLGEFLGEGSTCEPSGACCRAGGGCTVTAETCCVGVAGAFRGAGTSCEPVGACCLADGSCVEAAQVCCDTLGGRFMGGGSPCWDLLCEPAQLHVYGPIPNLVPGGGRGTARIDVVLQSDFVPLPGNEVVFAKTHDPALAGTYTFTSGDVSADGERAVMVTEANGQAYLTFAGDQPGYGIITVTVSDTRLTAYALFEVIPLPVGDFDGDGDSDLLDFATLQRCLSESRGEGLGPICAACDGDVDGDVDLADFAAFESVFTGPR